MLKKLIGALLACSAMSVANVEAAKFVRQPDVVSDHYSHGEQALVDQFWKETLI